MPQGWLEERDLPHESPPESDLGAERLGALLASVLASEGSRVYAPRPARDSRGSRLLCSSWTGPDELDTFPQYGRGCSPHVLKGIDELPAALVLGARVG